LLFYKKTVFQIIKDIFSCYRKSGNKASHDGNGSQSEALIILKKSFQLARWFYETENEYIETTEYELPEDDLRWGYRQTECGA
jgi:type I restriction enzyme R subunit